MKYFSCNVYHQTTSIRHLDETCLLFTINVFHDKLKEMFIKNLQKLFFLT